MKNDGSWDFSFWGIVLTGVLFLGAFGAGQWAAQKAELLREGTEQLAVSESLSLIHI